MKEKNKILNNNEKIYELKTEYMDDLVMKLDEKRPSRKKGFYIYFSTLLLLLVTGTIFWYSNQKMEENRELIVNKNPSITIKNETGSVINKEDKEASLIILNSNNEKEKSTIIDDKNKSVEHTPNFQLENNQKRSRIKSTSLLTAKKTPNQAIKNPDKIDLNNQFVLNKEEGLALVKKVERDKDQSLRTTEIKNEKRKKVKKNELLNSTNQEKQKEEKKESVTVDKDSSSKKKDLENEQDIKKENIDSVRSDKTMDTSTNKANIIVIKDSLIIEDSVAKIAQIDTVLINGDSSKFKTSWQLSLLGGANISFSRFSNSTNQKYSTLRKEEENYLVSFSGGINIEKFITKNVKMTTGLNYISYGTNTNYSPVESYKNSKLFNGFDSVYSPIMDSIFYNPTRIWLPYLTGIDTSVDSSFTNNKVPYEDSTAYLSKERATFSYVEIPLMIGYYKTINHWSFGINTGISLGLLTRSSGYFIGEDLQTVEVAKSQNIMWNYIIGPEINYEFRENYYFGIQSNFRLGLNDLSISEPIDRKYYNIQLNVKIGYRF
jgi:hypothetical protein